VCDRHYVFDAYQPPNSSQPLVFDPAGKCPAFVVNPKIARLALLKERADEVEYAQFVKENVSVAPTFSGLDGGMNKVFVTRFPGRIIPLAMVLTNGSQLPQLPPIPWTDNDGSLPNKFFDALLESKFASQRLVDWTDPATRERAEHSEAIRSTATAITKPAPAD
jgi:hypothetical protein